jgi:hypothetical protein
MSIRKKYQRSELKLIEWKLKEWKKESMKQRVGSWKEKTRLTNPYPK